MKEIYSISRLNLEARLLLESHFNVVMVEGELSNLRAPGQGHWYFTLKDDKAQVSCAMFRRENSNLKFTPTDGMHVLVQARIGLYEARGTYQIIVETMEPVGDGRLKQAFEALKKRLHQEGLFDVNNKKSLPKLPKQIGIITSPTGAAIRDILSVLGRRFAAIPILIYPSQVQGAQAADEIVAAIQTANMRKECDVLVLTRGGGSLEDLWPFNEERVARAIFASDIPIVSAVGHEIDFTIADFVADLRAATPSAAAELIVPDKKDLLTQLTHWISRLSHAMTRQIQLLQSKHTHLLQRLQHPGARILQQMQTVDHLREQLQAHLFALLHHKHQQLNHLSNRLLARSLESEVIRKKAQVENLNARLQHLIHTALAQKQAQLQMLASCLDSVSPIATLARGYAIVTDTTGAVLMDAQSVKMGTQIQARLSNGSLMCEVLDSF